MERLMRILTYATLLLCSIAQTCGQQETTTENSYAKPNNSRALDDLDVSDTDPSECTGPDCGVWMRDPNGAVTVRSGDDALLTCVVGSRKKPVIWKKAKDNKILTAGVVRVTNDARFYVLHDDAYVPPPVDETLGSNMRRGGDVWALVIKNVKPADAGLYMCEMNTVPVVRTFHKLTVISSGLTPPESQNSSTGQDWAALPLSPEAIAHNYTDCCLEANVTRGCLGFCSIQSIMDGTAQDPEACQPDFPDIVKCMADGRNHVPCCIQERVPDICQDVCRGEFNPVTDNIKTHYSCAAYMEKTLSCIVEGIELLPSPPENVEVDVLNEKQLNVSWERPLANSEYITNYLVNVTTLQSFDSVADDPLESFDLSKANSTISTKNAYMKIVRVPANKTFVVVSDLMPFTMYEITVTSYNIHGSSLPTYALRTLTLTPDEEKKAEAAKAPKLPDIRACCVKAGITHTGCIDKLCDPLKTVQIGLQVTDLMVCAPWAGDTFNCLTNGVDHSPCCKARGLPPSCLPLCVGNVTTIDFNYFKCLRYMSSYTSCLLQGYGVLPGPPTRLHVSNIGTDLAAVHWFSPRTLADTVLYYNLRYRKLTVGDDEDYSAIPKVKSPFILSDLESNTDYEVYIEAVNEHGVGEGSARLIFRTESEILEEAIEDSTAYNMTLCCERAALTSACYPLCSYDAKMSDLRTLARVCAPEFHKLLRCGAGGRNHESCCTRRGVHPACLAVCDGVLPSTDFKTIHTCMPYIGNIVQCFEEGTGILPGPARELHASKVSNGSIELQWSPPTDGTPASSYYVYYQKVDNDSAPYYYSTQSLESQVNTTDNFATLKKLQTGAKYHIFVVSVNEHGTSLPSSLLVVNATEQELREVPANGITAQPSPPHSVGVSGHSATWVTISWLPPQFSHADDTIHYSLFYKATGSQNFTRVNTSIPSHTLDNLTPNTQYIIYVKANTSAGESGASETLVAWTDPAYPAFVEPPVVNPMNLVVEGSSMTILCIAMGTPTPKITLHISGIVVRQETTRHMVTVIHNVTRDMNQITCYADNGYGTPMQSTRRITISHIPSIQASGITMAAAGDSVTLECRVEAVPKPSVAFWRDAQGRVPVIEGPKYSIQLVQDTEEPSKYTMRLVIHKISEPDEGDYFCHAENAFGVALRPVSVRLRNTSPHRNISECCIQENVKPQCLDACTFNLDLDSIVDRDECSGELSKLMKCAADGSDHRSCCASWGVPRSCLELCRGGATSPACVAQHGRRALACFRDAGARLPGVPRNLMAHPAPQHGSALLSWDPPMKNPQSVYLYRVFWRPLKSKVPEKLDTSETSVVITGLEEGTTYECVVKAANEYGTSALSDAIHFTPGAGMASAQGGGGAGAGAGAALACIVAAAALVAALFYYRRRRNLRMKSQNGVAFENPSYLREPNTENLNNTATAPPGDPTVRPNGINNGGVSNSSAWRQETLQTTAEQEINPTLYEELKLGSEGAGFKRLKS